MLGPILVTATLLYRAWLRCFILRVCRSVCDSHTAPRTRPHGHRRRPHNRRTHCPRWTPSPPPFYCACLRCLVLLAAPLPPPPTPARIGPTGLPRRRHPRLRPLVALALGLGLRAGLVALGGQAAPAASLWDPAAGGSALSTATSEHGPSAIAVLLAIAAAELLAAAVGGLINSGLIRVLDSAAAAGGGGRRRGSGGGGGGLGAAVAAGGVDGQPGAGGGPGGRAVRGAGGRPGGPPRGGPPAVTALDGAHRDRLP